MKKWIAKALLPLTLLAAAGVVVVVAGRTRKPDDPAPKGRERIGFQAADDPPVMPASGRLDPRFALLSAWQRAAVPVVSAVSSPSASGSFHAVAGETVFAVADGLVVFAGLAAEGGGRTAVLAHRGADGKEYHSIYAGLDKPDVATGLLVGRGGRLGVAGAAGCAVAVCRADEVAPKAGPDGGEAVGLLAGMERDGSKPLVPSVLGVALQPDEDPWSRLQVDDPKSAERLLEIIGKERDAER